MKLPFPRRFKAWLVALVSLTAVALVSIAPMMRPRAQSSTTYTFTDLGTLGTGTLSRARGINNCGSVVGEYNSVPNGQLRPFIWKDGVMKDLAPGASAGTAAAVNSSGFVTGTIGQVAFTWHDDNGDGNPDATERCNLGALPGDQYSDALDINDTNQIVGLSGADLVERAFFWEQGAMQVVGANNGITPLWALGINNAGHTVGVGDLASGEIHAWLRKGSSIIDLKTRGGDVSFAHDLNATEYVVGLSRIAGNSSQHAFIWHDDNGNGITDGCEPLTAGCEMKDLGTLGGTNSAAFDINASNIVVGYSDIIGGGLHAFVYDGTMRDLNSPGVVTNLPSGWVLERANAINDGGQIVGYGTIGGEIRAFLLTPTGFIPPACSSTLPAVNVSVSPSSVAEDGIGSLTYTFTRSIVTASPLVVNFSVGGDAGFATDYAVTGAASFGATAGTVTFGPCESTKTVTVDPATDSLVETDETVVLTTSPDAAYTIAAAPLNAATGTITNDDSIPIVSVTVSPPTAPEDGATNLVYTFNRTGSTANALTANFSVGGTAGFSSDYGQTGAATFTASTGTVTIPIGMASATVTVDPSVDTTDEPDETVILTISADAAYTIAAAPQHAASGTITDDDAVPTIQITNVTAPEPSPGPTSFVFTVSLTNPSSSPITVNYATDTTGATATGGAGPNCSAGIDFVNIPSTGLTFLAGETSKQVSVTVCGDTDLEPDETFFVNLSGNSANSNLATGTRGTGTITPQTPLIFTEEGNGTVAAAVDSVTFARGPFRLTNDLNFSSDRLTRIILFTSNLGMTNANLASGILSIHIAGYGQIPLANLEHVGPITGVAGLNASYIIVKLPADLPTGPNTLTVRMGGAESNATTLSIIP